MGTTSLKFKRRQYMKTVCIYYIAFLPTSPSTSHQPPPRMPTCDYLVTRTVLEHYTAHPPATEDVWYGPWTTILTTLFPSTQGYIVTPQRRLPDDPESHIPDFIIEVVKLSTPPITFRTVLIVKIKNSQHWQSGIGALERQLSRQTDAAFAGTAHTKVYWIGTIGPHWRYGEKDDNGQDPQPLIDWHHTTHDHASFDDLQVLAGLVGAL